MNDEAWRAEKQREAEAEARDWHVRQWREHFGGIAFDEMERRVEQEDAERGCTDER